MVGRLLEQGQSRKVMRRQMFVPVEQCRTCYRHQIFAQEEVGFGAGPLAVAVVDGSVEFLVVEQERPRAGGQVNRDVRALSGEFRQARQQPARRESRRNRQLDGAAGAPSGHQVERIPLDPRQVLRDLARVGLPGFGEHDAAAVAPKQCHVELRL